MEKTEQRAVTLKKLLTGMKDKTAKIKIGAEEGSGFFYVGTVEDFLANSDKYEESDIAYFDNRVERANNNLDNALNVDTSFSGDMKKQYRIWKTTGHTPLFNVDGFDMFLKMQADLVSKRFKSLIKEKTIRAEHKALLTRRVARNEKADITIEPDDVLIIVLVGHENGAFWTMDEADEPTMRFSGNNEDEVNA